MCGRIPTEKMRSKIYDLDSDPVDVRRWTELENVRVYYEFFKKHEKAFLTE